MQNKNKNLIMSSIFCLKLYMIFFFLYSFGY